MSEDISIALEDLKFRWYSAKRRGNFHEADKYKHLMRRFIKQLKQYKRNK